MIQHSKQNEINSINIVCDDIICGFSGTFNRIPLFWLILSTKTPTTSIDFLCSLYEIYWNTLGFGIKYSPLIGTHHKIMLVCHFPSAKRTASWNERERVRVSERDLKAIAISSAQNRKMIVTNYAKSFWWLLPRKFSLRKLLLITNHKINRSNKIGFRPHTHSRSRSSCLSTRIPMVFPFSAKWQQIQFSYFR